VAIQGGSGDDCVYCRVATRGRVHRELQADPSPTGWNASCITRGMSARRVWTVLALLAAGCGPADTVGPDTRVVIAAMQQRSLLREQGLALADPADLRLEARNLLRNLNLGRLPDIPLPAITALPKTIRVWRKSLGGSDSCTGQVDVLPLETYVKGVLPHEWISSWKQESLRSGAVAIRTYATAWILKGGKYNCADLCDTTSSQVYKDSTLPVTNQAVDDTAGQILVTGSSVVFAEYSAENGDPTKTGVSDPVCAGKTLYGHGRGMCQWGSQRWALQGKSYTWIAPHYYPGATLWSAVSTLPPDAGTPKVDSAAPKTDSASPRTDREPGPDPVRIDGGSGMQPDGYEAPPLSPPAQSATGTLTGGCSVGGGASGAEVMLVLVVLGGVRRRARSLPTNG